MRDVPSEIIVPDADGAITGGRRRGSPVPAVDGRDGERRGETTLPPAGPPAAVTQRPSRRPMEGNPAHVRVHGERDGRAHGSRLRAALLCRLRSPFPAVSFS